MSDERIRSETTDYLDGLVSILDSDDCERLMVNVTESMINWIAKGDNAERLAKSYAKIVSAVSDTSIKNIFTIIVAKRKVEKAIKIGETAIEEFSNSFDDIQKMVSSSNEETNELKKEIKALKDQFNELINAAARRQEGVILHGKINKGSLSLLIFFHIS